MSKPSRRPNRAIRPKGRRARRSQMKLTPSGGLHLVVATVPNGSMSLEHDLQPVRSALLYADTVEFLSPLALLVSFTEQLASGDIEVVAATLAQLDDDTAAYLLPDGLDRDAVLEVLSLINQVNALPRAVRRKHVSAELTSEVRTATASMKASLAEIGAFTAEVGMPELTAAIDSGALSLNVALFEGDDPDGIMDRYVDILKTHLEAPGTHLLLDDQMSGIARSMIAEGMATPSQTGLSRAVRTHAGTRLVSHLPAFPDAKVADILEARDELSDPLSAYRAGMKAVEKSLNSQAFDPELPSEIDELWRDEVDPTIRRLRVDLSKTRIARAAGLNIGADATRSAGAAALTVGVASAVDWVSLSTTASMLGPGYVISQGIKAIKETQAARDEARSHDMFYLLQLQDKLAT